MLQLRLWLTVVVIVLSGAVVMLQGTSALHERVMLPFEYVTTQATNALQGHVVRNASEAVDAAARATVDPAVRAVAKSGTSTPEADAALLAPAGGMGRPTFAVVAKADGTVVVRSGQPVSLESPLNGFPLFLEATSGVARDGLHYVDGKPYQLAAAPAYDGANLGAVVILGWIYDDAFVDRISKSLSAPVVLLAGGKRIGQALPELSAEVLSAPAGSAGAFDLGNLPAFLPLLVKEDGRYLLSSVPVFRGDEAFRLALAIDRNPAFVAIAGAQLIVLGGTGLIALLQIALILTTLRAVDKSVAVIVDHLSQVSQGSTVGILPEAGLQGQFLRLGKQVNMILQMTPAAGRTTSGVGAPVPGKLPRAMSGAAAPPLTVSPASSAPAPGILDEAPLPSKTDTKLVAPTSQPVTTGAASAATTVPRSPTPGASPASVSPPAPPAPAPAPASSGLSSLFDANAEDPLAAFRVPPKVPTQQTPAPPQATTPAALEQEQANIGSALLDDATDAPTEDDGEMKPEATVMFQVPQELLNKSVALGAAVDQPTSTRPVDDARTQAHAIPAELLSASARPAEDTDEPHYREVYEKFVQTRIECGEDTSDLTYDRFVVKLMKNRQQIVDKHKAKGVRFQVYVKDGKAALRALPVRA